MDVKLNDQPCNAPPTSGLCARLYARRIKSWLYFATTPYCNYPLNLVLHRRFTRRFIPKVIYIETTNTCNAHCIMCPHDKMNRKQGYMDWDLFADLIDQCAMFEGRGLNIFLHKDGEPLMDPRIFDRLAYARQKLPRSRLHFNTNAALMDEAKAEAILKSPLDSLVFSIDGASAQTYEAIRQGLNYERVTANVQAFFRLKRALGSRLHVTLQMVMNQSNRHEVARYRDIWGGLADRVVFKPMHNFLVQGTALHGGAIGAGQLERCSMPFHVMLIYSNGDVGLCCWDYDNIMKLGNIRERTVLEVYNNEPYAAVRNAMRARMCEHIRPCSTCSQIYGHDGPMWQRALDFETQE